MPSFVPDGHGRSRQEGRIRKIIDFLWRYRLITIPDSIDSKYRIRNPFCVARPPATKRQRADDRGYDTQAHPDRTAGDTARPDRIYDSQNEKSRKEVGHPDGGRSGGTMETAMTDKKGSNADPAKDRAWSQRRDRLLQICRNTSTLTGSRFRRCGHHDAERTAFRHAADVRRALRE